MPAFPEARGESPPETVLQGVVEHVAYHDPESRYSVLRILPEKGYDDPTSRALLRLQITAVGPVPAPAEGQRVRLRGRWTTHRTHGRQFAFELSETLPPLDAGGLVRYLSSSAFEGVGEVLAKRIVAQLGTNALAV